MAIRLSNMHKSSTEEGALLPYSRLNEQEKLMMERSDRRREAMFCAGACVFIVFFHVLIVFAQTKFNSDEFTVRISDWYDMLLKRYSSSIAIPPPSSAQPLS